ncbi:PepSY domain-containing protein [Niveispirillum sp. KHB5.9]|uniref:PepSY domain-containing protein n=1 Tax=Niveispirillum sp. KHB5.9 TaxID=3400269 RepID=UPI003A8BF28F
MTTHRRALIATLITAPLVLAAATGWAGDDKKRKDKDHDAAREALRRGEILPLIRILEIVGREQPGDILEIELEDDPVSYEVKVLAPDGRVRKLVLDARTGAVLKRKGD